MTDNYNKAGMDNLPFYVDTSKVIEQNVDNRQEKLKESTMEALPALPISSPPTPPPNAPKLMLSADADDRRGELRMLQYLNEAGLNIKDARSVNKTIVSNSIDLQFMAAKHDEEYFHRERMLALGMMYNSMKTGNIVQGPDGGFVPAPKPRHIDLREIEKEFQKKYLLVKIRTGLQVEPTFFRFCEVANRHVPATFKDIQQEYSGFLDEHLSDEVEISQQELDRSLRRLKHAIPFLKNADLHILENTIIMFNNGIYDVKTASFKLLERSERLKYFTLFSINLDWGEKIPEPTVFDAVLDDMFGGNSEKKHLAYQIIGAFLTPVPISKKLYLFQGVSNGGKTRLSRIIERLMEEEDTCPLPTLSDITSGSLVKLVHPIRLVTVQEMRQTIIPSKQLATLKGFADGNEIPGASSFKILMNSNYPIFTGENGFIEPAMLNRLVVLPFEKVMDNIDPDVASFEDCHFAREKAEIIHKALLAFSEVLNNGGKFCASYAPNECVQVAEPSGQLSADDRERLELAAAKHSAASSEDEKTILQQALKATLVLQATPNLQMTPEIIMDAINEVLPESVKDTASLGKILRATFGEGLTISRPNGKTCYNLAWKVKEEKTE